MGRKEAYDYLKRFVLEQMRVPDLPHYPMNDLRKVTLLRYHPTGEVTSGSAEGGKVGNQRFSVAVRGPEDLRADRSLVLPGRELSRLKSPSSACFTCDKL
jgi:hypothetical protein